MEKKFVISLAGVAIAIRPIYDDIRAFCRGYLSEEEPAFAVAILPEDIAFERTRLEAEDRREGVPVRSFSDGSMEILAVYRKIALGLLDYGIVLIHGSCVAVDGKSYLFAARSGTGKSTHARLWRQQFGARAVMVNDDKPLLKLTEDGVMAFGTPWSGKHRLDTNIGCPLKAICLLRRSEENRIVPADVQAHYPDLLRQIYLPREPQALARTLVLLDGILARVELYTLECNMEPAAALVSYRGMNKEKMQ